MICPSKICAQSIPDDSCFCDQCGTQLLRCEKCGFISTGKRCGKCGGVMLTIMPPEAQTLANPSTLAVSSSVSSAAASSAATVAVQLPVEKIFLCHSEGWNIDAANGDILGRTNGQHMAKLGRFPVISSNHAKVTQQNNEWFITDLHSTNKTYINGTKLEPNIPAKINQDDVVILANVAFTVREL